MATLREQIDTYLQETLKMQYVVSKCISHALTKGELRERFIKRLVQDEFPEIILKSGILYSDNWQSPQADFLWLRNGARIGSLALYDLNDCRMFMEIKSCATAAELRAINVTAHNLKVHYSGDLPLTVGMFCYRTDASEIAILKKFGFTYDKDIEGYSSYMPSKDIMQNVDFFFSLNISEDEGIELSPFLIVRERSNGCCILYKDNPVIKYYLNYFR